MIDDTILDIAAQYADIVVHFDDENCSRNNGACAGKDIFLGEFDDDSIKMFAFFHELAHAVFPFHGAEYHLSAISCEGAAWEYAIGLAAKHGYKYDYDSPEFQYGRQKLYTYVHNQTGELQS
ncbi:MAG: hypothetical protein ACLP9L_41790 [Thermoguttaceae bacterium]